MMKISTNSAFKLSDGTSALIRYPKYHHCPIVNPYKMVVMSTDSLTMHRPDFATPVVTGYNPMPGSENLIVKDSNGCSEPGIGIVTGNTILPGIGMGIVNPAISQPAGKGPLQQSQRTRQTLFIPL